ncbi:MAG TPA: Mur ligase domain-containing protein, partial [Thermoanaerobaculia bacterium]|nr:Mur ligase domain-containing protein [Thermoanaerobaculia bacterium]
MRLSELARDLGLAVPPGSDRQVTGVEHDSRQVRPGDLFVALPGQRFDGRAFAAAAVAAGAVAIVGPEPGEAAAVAVPWRVADDPRALLGPLAARVYGHPDRELILAGVTGTT